LRPESTKNAGQGRSVEAYTAPLFLAWQLTNRCSSRCIACCEESGPDKGWADELTREEALRLTRQIVAAGIPYVAFGGGEPLGSPHCWEIFELLSQGGVLLKIETDGQHIDEAAADRLAVISTQCIQISVDGASAATHERVRPGSDFGRIMAAIRRLVARGVAPQMVFAPNRINIHEMTAAYELAAELGCSAFVTGPLMRIGRAAAAWDTIAVTEEAWRQAEEALRARAAGHEGAMVLSIYPWDILTEIEKRHASPQAMLLVVPNGRVKLLNALPFSPADLRQDSIETAWQAYRDAWRSSEVAAFVAACRTHPDLLRHANETWSLRAAAPATLPPVPAPS
jgi:MoaA/NifB/PqqE/SkfB family radical SAM enzyme